MNGARLGIMAQSVGISEAAYREAYNYAIERRQFGKAIIEFPAVYEMIANIRAKPMLRVRCYTKHVVLWICIKHWKIFERTE